MRVAGPNTNAALSGVCGDRKWKQAKRRFGIMAARPLLLEIRDAAFRGQLLAKAVFTYHTKE